MQGDGAVRCDRAGDAAPRRRDRRCLPGPVGDDHRGDRHGMVGDRLSAALLLRAAVVSRVFVTGATGLLGSALTQRLTERGDDVVALARSDTAAQKLAARGITVVRGETYDEDALATGIDRKSTRLNSSHLGI